ncbi:MAG: alanine--glyoxylate aminotransferase family protein [Planctomycetota bacterium]
MLMIPGPSDVPPEALAQMSLPVLPHYGDEYLEIHRRVLEGLKTVFGTSGTVIMVPGPGTAGTEMALCGLACEKTLVVEAGVFAHRMAEILVSHGGDVVPLPVPERRAVDPDDVRSLVKSTPGLGAVAVVHNESSTGVIHPLREIGRIAREHDLLFAVDVVSSLSGADVSMDDSEIDIAWSAPQKALSAPAGLAFVALNDRALARLESRRDRIRGWLLNPLVWKWHIDNWAWHPYPTSLPTAAVRGLDVSLRLALEEGLPKRYARHTRAAGAVRAAACALGMTPFPERTEFASPTISSLIPPVGVDEAKMREHVLAESDVWIAGGFGPLRGRIIRIGHMGEGARPHAVLATVAALEDALRAQKHRIPPGSAAEAAAELLA